MTSRVVLSCVLGLVLTLVAGCRSVTPADYPCNEQGDCPPSYHCPVAGGFCTRSLLDGGSIGVGASGDGGSDGGAADGGTDGG